jgi:copper oxidase (laccase) domain-containing protein
LTTDPPLLQELPSTGPVPRYTLAEWRSRYGVVAGVTARGEGPPKGFDLGLWTREPVGEVMARWVELRGAEPGFRCFFLGHQVHGSTVVRHAAGTGWIVVEGVDGHITTDAGVLLLVTVADCIPVYLVAPGRAVGLLHAGWRGTAAGILERGLAELERLGYSPASIVMHLGVGICGDCYQVGSEVMSGCGVPAPGPGPWRLDLRRVLAERAGRAGVRQVTMSPWCSAHHAPRFYSHRASGGTDGRMAAYIGMPSGTS